MRKLKLAAALAGAASIAFGATALPTPAAAQAAPAFEMGTFAQHPFMSDPVISPSGRYLAAKLRVRGEQYLAIIDLENRGAAPIMVGKDGEFDKRDDVVIQDWEWHGDDYLLVRASSRQDFEGSKYDAVRLLAFTRATGKIVPLGWDDAISGGRILWKSREGEPRLLLERYSGAYGWSRLNRPEVAEIDVRTGRQKVVMEPNSIVDTWYADGKGNVRMGTGFDRDSGKLRIMYRSGGSGFPRTVQNEKEERYGSSLVPHVFLDEPDKGLVFSNASGFTELYEMDLRTMTLGRKIYAAPGYDLQGVISNRERNGAEGVVVIRDGVEIAWFDPRHKAVQAVLDESFGKGKARVVSADDKRERVVIRAGGPNQAGAYYLYNTATGATSRLAWVNETFKDREMNPVKTIRYKASDGKDIPAVLTLPRGRAAKNLPLIVLPHGGPWARDFETWDHWSQALAELGYAVVQPNFRGSTGFGRAWTELADGNWGERMQDDLNDSITALAQLGIADPKRVCMFGWSYGGYAASRAAQRDGSKYRCAITGAGVHDIPAMVKYDRNYLGRYGSSFIGGAATDLRTVSPSLYPEQYSIPIMIVHGAKDARVPVDQSRDLVRRLKKAGKKEGVDFVYLEQPRNTHHLPLEEDRTQLLEEMKKFLAKHNPA